MAQRTDIIVIGAGYAGLTAAALLARSDRQVTLLEAHDTLGGCASFFRIGRMTFDVGATTLSGLAAGRPAHRVFDALGIVPAVIRQDPAMVVRMDDEDIVRTADPEAWIVSMERRFPRGNQRRFWTACYAVEAAVWRLIAEQPALPPSTATEWLRMLHPASLRALPLVVDLVRPMRTLMRRCGVDADPAFCRFVDEQLLISTQSTADRAPVVTAAMGLTYASDMWYPVGGMVRPAIQLMRSATADGGDVRFRRRVVSVVPHGRRWMVTTANGEQWLADRVVSSLLPSVMTDITDGGVRAWMQRQDRRSPTTWAALTMYLAVDGVPNLPSTYMQIHGTGGLPFCDSDSFFVTFSHPSDHSKAPEGTTTITVSTHTRPGRWERMTADERREAKALVERTMYDALRQRVPELDGMRLVDRSSATPWTWQRYTGRPTGRVGGAAHDVRRPLLTMPRNHTPFAGLSMIGDGVFPGQGVPAVMVGAWNTVQRIFAT